MGGWVHRWTHRWTHACRKLVSNWPKMAASQRPESSQDCSIPPELTETMISAIVWLDILLSPNVLMLKALIFSMVATCSRRAAISSDSTSFEDSILCAQGQGWAQPPWLEGGFGSHDKSGQGIPTGHTGFTGRHRFSREPTGHGYGAPLSSHPAPASCGTSSCLSLLDEA